MKMLFFLSKSNFIINFQVQHMYRTGPDQNILSSTLNYPHFGLQQTGEYDLKRSNNILQHRYISIYFMALGPAAERKHLDKDLMCETDNFVNILYIIR